MRYLALRLTFALSIVLAVFVRVTPMQAASTITVNTTSDIVDSSDGLCSLREAIIAANTNAASGATPGECPAGGATDTIAFSPSLPVPATFPLSATGAGEDSALTGDLDIVGTVTINGSGAAATILDGNATDRVLEIRPGARVTVSGVTIRNGNPGTGVDGGGIAVGLTGRLTLNNSTVLSNTASHGGGAMVLGLLTLNDSTVENNQGGGVRNDAGLLLFTNVSVLNNTGDYGIYNQNGATLSFSGGAVSGNQGGGIYNTGSTAVLDNLSVVNNTEGSGVHNSGATAASLTLSNSSILSNTATSGSGILNEGLGAVADISDTRISFNSATAGGGGISNAGSLTLDASTVDHNQARSGGGIDHGGSNLTLTNSTLSGNIASDNGGGLHNRSSATLANVTLDGNQSDTGANIYNDGDTAALTMRNSIVASPQVGANCVNNIGVITSNGYNLESTDTCNLGSVGDTTSTDPMLGPLQDNGGATFTHALLSGSPGIGAGNPAQPGSGGDACPATDQRGVSRPQGTTCDVGSYEFIIGGQADLSVAKVDAIDPVTVGDNITYTVTVSNNGPDAAQNVVLSDALPGGVSYVSASPDQGSCIQAGSVVSCNLGSIPAASSAAVIVVVATTADGTLTNSATVSSDTADPNPGDNGASEGTTISPLPVPEADLSLAILDTPDPVDAIAPLTYTLLVTNAGPDAAAAVTVTDQLPAGVTYSSASGSGWGCGHLAGTVTCTRPSLAVGVAPAITLLVIAPVRSGTITNTAAVAGREFDPSVGDNSAAAGTWVNVAHHYVYLPLVAR